MARGAYAKGKWALGECARSGRKMLLRNMIADGYYPNLIVDPEWYEPKHPQEAMPSLKDPTTLFRPAPDRSRIGATIKLGGIGEGLGAGGSSVSSGYELGRIGASFESSSFSTPPFVMFDASTIHFGFDVNWFFAFDGASSQLKTRDGTFVETPQQYGELEPLQFAGGFQMKWFQLSGAPFDLVSPAENVLVPAGAANTILVGYLRPPPATRLEGIMTVEGFADADLVNPIARANYEVIYDRP